MKKTIAAITAIAICLALSSALADYTPVTVTASELNGRGEPSTRADVESRFVHGDVLDAIGYALGWVEVIGGETGTVWCKAEYLAESTDETTYENTSGARVRVHKELGGGESDLVRWIKAGKQIKTTRTLLGWGRVSDGWIDLSFFAEVQESQ